MHTAFLYLLRFFTPLCFAVPMPILSRALLSTLIIFSSSVLLLYPSIPYFLFLAAAANPSLLHRVFASRFFLLPAAVHLSLPLLFLFRFLRRVPSFSLPTARICMRESNLGCYGKHNVQRERERERERGEGEGGSRGGGM
ncbi:hypothetical protein PUN28_006964 [Cardiocondyla obscurior]|uniref:Transmembrane protein n=1 Tax=Cardiocondyla obscurior TaxID=286306 RepID=A0AAW2G2E9_9HYME